MSDAGTCEKCGRLASDGRYHFWAAKSGDVEVVGLTDVLPEVGVATKSRYTGLERFDAHLCGVCALPLGWLSLLVLPVAITAGAVLCFLALWWVDSVLMRGMVLGTGLVIALLVFIGDHSSLREPGARVDDEAGARSAIRLRKGRLRGEGYDTFFTPAERSRLR